MKFLLVCTV